MKVTFINSLYSILPKLVWWLQLALELQNPGTSVPIISNELNFRLNLERIIWAFIQNGLRVRLCP
jgi:hypothetical protein